jgi:hypothetical protein
VNKSQFVPVIFEPPCITCPVNDVNGLTFAHGYDVRANSFPKHALRFIAGIL